MPQYKYIAKRYSDGKTVRGTIDAPDRKELSRKLDGQGLYLISAAPAQRGVREYRIDPRTLAVLCREVAQLLIAGLPLMSVLRTLAEHASDKETGPFMKTLAAEIEAGATFAEGWRQHCVTGREIGAAIIGAGERSGRLPSLLLMLAEYLEANAALRSRILGMLWYPAVLAAAAGLSVLLFLTVILPRFSELLTSLDVELPLITRVVMGIGHFAGRYWPGIALAVLAAAAGLWGLRKMNFTRRLLDQWTLRLPLVGPLVQLAATGRLAETVAVLVESGLPVTTAFRAAAETMGNWSIKQGLIEAANQMTQGATVAEAIAGRNLLLPLGVELISVGEQSGRLPDMLHHLADFCKDKLTRQTERLSAVLEPAIILPAAGIVATLAASMLMPYFKLVQSIQ